MTIVSEWLMFNILPELIVTTRFENTDGLETAKTRSDNHIRRSVTDTDERTVVNRSTGEQHAIHVRSYFEHI